MTTRGQFFHLTLRTLDVGAARNFYATVLGVSGAGLDVVPLHEAAIAKGARPHWLGFSTSVKWRGLPRRLFNAVRPRWVPNGSARRDSKRR